MTSRQNHNKNHGPVIEPSKGKNDPQLGPDALMLMIPSEIKHLVSVAKARSHPLSDISMRRLFLVEKANNGPVAISGPFLGAPHAVLGMEKLIALGAKRLWIMGWCGAISSSLRIGDMFIPTSAISEEGTSNHYPIKKGLTGPEEDLIKYLTRIAGQYGVKITHGPIWTTDAPYRETRKKILEYQSKGILAVDMELSALMTVAAYRSVGMAALLVVSDELFSLTWKRGFTDPKLKQASHLASEILLRAALNYDQS